ncbi:hypothetical protein JRQ81_000910 [Phrynocephalus forsythii]|uniref:Mitochondrial 2-oxodicarboxylate carrier n=1 Tax=Phrynocephalus forsythii TaxID=171643 RepID=A0A9Q0Y651_9SAUR|nr:hypothetical protein JRQ81_000910 [Phrynocephalus forsythii]
MQNGDFSLSLILGAHSDILFGFYKGILPPILAETPKRAVKFFTFEQYKKLLGNVSLPPALTFAVAGLGSGLTEAVVVNPFEVVKVSLQANRNAFAEQPSTFAKARQIIQTDGVGLGGLNKGLPATLGRHGVFNMIYFGFYFNVKNIIPVNKKVKLLRPQNEQKTELRLVILTDFYVLRGQEKFQFFE